MLETIPAKELDQYVYDPLVLIVDLRIEEEYEAGHIAGALNVPPQELMGLRPGNDRMLVLYCGRGGFSLEVARRLAGKGYQVKSVVGGYRAYRGKNIVTGKRRDGQIGIDSKAGGH